MNYTYMFVTLHSRTEGFSGVKDGVIWLRDQTNDLFRNSTGASKFDHREGPPGSAPDLQVCAQCLHQTSNDGFCWRLGEPP